MHQFKINKIHAFFVAIFTGIAIIPACAGQINESAGLAFSGSQHLGPVPHYYIDKAVTIEPILATINPGMSFIVQGHEIKASHDSIAAEQGILRPATALVGISTAAFYVASLDGTIQVDNVPVPAGSVRIYAAGTVSPITHQFDVRRFLSSAGALKDNNVRLHLEALSEQQQSKIFWGGLSRTASNVQSMAKNVFTETALRSYMNHPEVAAIRFSGKGADGSALATARRFFSLMGQMDVDMASGLVALNSKTDNSVDTKQSIADLIAKRFTATRQLANRWRKGNLNIENITLTDGGLWVDGIKLEVVNDAGMPFLSMASIEAILTRKEQLKKSISEQRIVNYTNQAK